MILQESTRENTEKAWVNILNVQGATMTTHWPAMRIQVVPASVGAALEAAFADNAMATAGVGGGVIGLMDEDLPDGDVGIVQVYGYHESVRVASLNKAAVTVVPGTPIGQVDNPASIGVSSVALSAEGFAVALDTIGTQHSAALVAEPAYANHVFIRAC